MEGFPSSSVFVNVFIVEVLSSWLGLFVASSPSYCERYFYLISFLESLLSVYKKATDSYMLILYPIILLKVLTYLRRGEKIRLSLSVSSRVF